MVLIMSFLLLKKKSIDLLEGRDITGSDSRRYTNLEKVTVPSQDSGARIKSGNRQYLGILKLFPHMYQLICTAQDWQNSFVSQTRGRGGRVIVPAPRYVE